MRTIYVRVGMLAALSALLLLGALLALGGGKLRGGRPFETYLRDSVQGLDVGGPVKYRGVVVGQVSAIGLVNADYGDGVLQTDPAYRQVLVRFEVDPARLGAMPTADTLARDGLRARIAPQGLTGQSYLELDFLDAARFPAGTVPWRPSAEYIPSAQSTLSQVQDAATVLLAKMQRVDIAALSDGLIALLADLRGAGLRSTLAEAGDTLRLLHAGLAASDVPGLAAELRRALVAARMLAQGPQTQALLHDAAQATARLTQATERLPPLLAALQDLARRADGGSADVEAALAPLLRDARATVATLREASEALRRDPAQLVLQGPPPRGLSR